MVGKKSLISRKIADFLSYFKHRVVDEMDDFYKCYTEWAVPFILMGTTSQRVCPHVMCPRVMQYWVMCLPPRPGGCSEVSRRGA